MSSINKLPLGLLGFLGIKNSGTYPRDLSPVLTPTFDLAQQYFSANQKLARVNVSVAAVGFQSAGTVPFDQIWAVNGASFNSAAVLGAGVTVRGFLAAALIDGVAFSVIPLGAYRSMTVGEVYASEQYWSGVKYLPPGSLLGFYCTFLAAGPVACQLQLQYAQMDT